VKRPQKVSPEPRREVGMRKRLVVIGLASLVALTAVCCIRYRRRREARHE
jgi:hypothetical protein